MEPIGEIRKGTAERSRKQEFWLGIRDESPILLGVIPFGLIYGALAVHAQLTAAAAQAMSAIIFAGSAQIIVTQLLTAGSTGLVMVMVVFVVNLRHALYSASVAPYLRSLQTAWKVLLAYLLTDEAYAVVITHYQGEGLGANRHWYFFGAGLTLWTAWQVSSALGIFIGASLPQSTAFSFVLPLTFIALVVPALKDLAGLTAAVTAAVIGVMAMNFPFKLGLLAAALLGILVGMAVEGKRS